MIAARLAALKYWAAWTGLLLHVVYPARESPILRGAPLDLLGFTLAVLLVGASVVQRPSIRKFTLSVVVVLVIAKLFSVEMMLPRGWATSYYANPRFVGTVERSTDYRDSRWTRLTTHLDFAGNSFPLHFFNELRFNFSNERRAPGFSAVYRGFLRRSLNERLMLSVTTPNEFRLLVNDREVIKQDQQTSPTDSSASVTLHAGVNVIEVWYSNPANVARRLSVVLADSRGLTVERDLRPYRTSTKRERMSQIGRVVSAMCDSGAIAVILWLSVWPLLSAVRSSVNRTRYRAMLVIGSIVLAISVHLLWKPNLNQPVIFIESGNDGLAYEDYARRALIEGVLLDTGTLQGTPYLYTIGYHYWMSVAHFLFGESLVSIYFAQQLLFLMTVALSVVIAAQLGGRYSAILTAVIGVYMKASVFWPQSYVFRENLVIFMNAALICAVLLSTHLTQKRAAGLGILTGANILTDPINLVVLPLIGFFVWRHTERPHRRAVIAAFGLATVAILAVVPVRNFVVAGVPMPLPTEGAPTLWYGNRPPPGLPDHVPGADDYYRVVINYAITEPLHFARNLVEKAVYAAGFYGIRWKGNPMIVQFSLTNVMGLLLATGVALHLFRSEPRIMILYAMAVMRFASEVIFLAHASIDRYEIALLMLLLPVISCALTWIWGFSRVLVGSIAVAFIAWNYMLVFPQLGNFAFSSRVRVTDPDAVHPSVQHSQQNKQLVWRWPRDASQWLRGENMVAFPQSGSRETVFQLLHPEGGGGFDSPVLDVSARLIKLVNIEAAFFGWPHVARLFIQFGNRQQGPDGVFFPVDSTGRFRRYVVPVYRSESWQGDIRTLSIHYAGDAVVMRSFELVPYGEQ